MVDPEQLRYDERGLITVVVQDIISGAVLMVAWADQEAVRRTVDSGDGWFWSRSRQELWRKGATSGNVLRVAEIAIDCDADTLLYRVHAAGPACHRGHRTCFCGEVQALARDLPTEADDSALKGSDNPARLELGWLRTVLERRQAAGDTDASYTARLLAAGTPRVAQKVAEEAVEVAIGSVVHSQAAPPDLANAHDELVGEAADLLYHLSVLLLDRDIDPTAVARRLSERHRPPPTAAQDSPDHPEETQQ